MQFPPCREDFKMDPEETGCGSDTVSQDWVQCRGPCKRKRESKMHPTIGHEGGGRGRITVPFL
jgi:hypothetical protein